MIELAPSHKTGLPLKGRVMLAAGFGGYSDEYADLVDLSLLGALVTVPTMLRRRVSGREPRAIETPGGALVSRGATNPGLAEALRAHRHAWAHQNVPIILSLAAEGARDWPHLAQRAARVQAIRGLELEITEELEAAPAIRLVREACSLPLLAKIPLTGAVEAAEECMHAGADALVIGLPPRADHVSVLPNPNFPPRVWKGRLYGPGIKAVALRALRKVKELGSDVPLIGCGGIHSVEDARECLALGAVAIQIDTLLWHAPERVNEIVEAVG